MGKAYKCALTGKLGEGDGVQVVHVEFTKTLKAEVRFFERTNNAYLQGAICPDDAEKIKAALVASVGITPAAEPVAEKK